jgi:hypothetical protein
MSLRVPLLGSFEGRCFYVVIPWPLATRMRAVSISSHCIRSKALIPFCIYSYPRQSASYINEVPERPGKEYTPLRRRGGARGFAQGKDTQHLSLCYADCTKINIKTAFAKSMAVPVPNEQVDRQAYEVPLSLNIAQSSAVAAS